MYKSLYSKPLRDNIVKKEHWELNTFDKVDWKAYGRTFRKMSRTRQITWAKLSHRLLQTNSQNARFYGAEPSCPCCNKVEETYSHMLTCGSEVMTAERDRLLEVYCEVLADIGTPPKITSMLLQGLQSWCRTQQENLVVQVMGEQGTLVDKACWEAYFEQTYVIGWEQFLRGRVSKQWGKVVSADNQLAA